MEVLIQGKPHVTVYLYDILSTGKNDQAHLVTLSTPVLDCLNDASLCLKCSKCVIMASSVEYLGQTIDTRGLHPKVKKVKAINNAPVSQNITELRAYWGLLA